MINYFKELFTKPEYQWSAVDRLAMAGLVLVVTIIIFFIWFIIWFIFELIKEHKFKTCRKTRQGNLYCSNCCNCLRCSDYKKNEKKGEKK